MHQVPEVLAQITDVGAQFGEVVFFLKIGDVGGVTAALVQQEPREGPQQDDVVATRASDDWQSHLEKLLEVGMGGNLELAAYVEFPANFEQVGELPVHLALEDGVVKHVEDHRMASLVTVLKDVGKIMG